MTKQKKYPMRGGGAVDVDGTLHNNGVASQQVIDWCERRVADGFSLMLWSARGEAHARQAAELFGVAHLFDHIVAKPSYLVDDLGWSWIKYTQVVTDLRD